MEKVNEEKSLVKVDNSIFARMRRFFHGLFSRRKNAEYIEEVENSEDTNKVSVEKEDVKREVYTEPKLFNFDNPQYEYDSTLGKKPILNEDNRNDDQIEGTSQLSFENTSISRYFTNDDEKTNEEYNVENSEDESSLKSEDEGYDEEKEELEKKLMNFYASIKGAIQ
jgi:hypothetical protein